MHTAVAFPRVSRPQDDLVVTMLDRIQCLTPDPVTGKVKRTRLALSMHTMRGDRGNYLAEAIRRKWVQGCDVRVSYGLIGYHTKGVGNDRLSGGLAGVVGVLVVLTLAGGLVLVVRRRRTPDDVDG